MPRKKVKKRSKPGPKENKGLCLGGPTPDFKWVKIRKNAPMPQGRGSFYWDHLISRLDEGDEFTCDDKRAHAFCTRARKLGFVVILNKLDEDVWNVWFGGLKK